MFNRKLFTLFALGIAFALTAALPAAADREDKTPRLVNPVVAPATPAAFGSSNFQKVRVHWKRSPQTSGNPGFMLKAYCEGTCADGTGFWCSGSSADCSDGDGCVGSGGGVTVIVSCDAD